MSYSFEDEFSTLNTNINGTHFILTAIKDAAPNCRFYFAGSSEMFGNAEESPETEKTAINPRSPYGISKLAGFHLTRNYREAYGIFAVGGILFNHESPRRGLEFVTRKISHTVASIKLGLARELSLGNLAAMRDWGYAGDYVKGMWLMLQQKTPEDYVLGTGKTHSVKSFLEAAFQCVNLNWQDYVVSDDRFFRPAEIYELKGDASKARERLGWKPSVGFQELVEMMVKSDLAEIDKSGKKGF